MLLTELVDYLDRYMDVAAFDDRSNNGLQVEGAAEVTRVAFCVDAGEDAFHKAIDAGAQLLIVHHGMFWSEPIMVRAAQHRRLQTLFAGGLSLYGCHLPLDAHPEVGNNAELARLLFLQPVQEFGIAHGRPVGLIAQAGGQLSLEELRQRLATALDGPAWAWPFRDRVQRIGVLTGNAMGVLGQAIDARLDALVCGELGHMVYHDAKEAGLGVVFGGHYATETVGLRALARHLSRSFALETVWVDVPTGL